MRTRAQRDVLSQHVMFAMLFGLVGPSYLIPLDVNQT